MFSSMFEVVIWALMAAGLWKILVKCGQKGWWALIPGLRWYGLGICADREREGLFCMIMELLSRIVLNIVRAVYGRSTEVTDAQVLVLIILGVEIALLVYEIRIELGLLQRFSIKKRWMFLWILFPAVAALIMGFGSRFQPVMHGREAEDAELAGMKPADLSAAVDADESDDGLVVHVRERTAKDLHKTRYLLKDINLTIPNGSLVLLLGGSGSGKTTLVNAINGYEKADATVKLNGMDIYNNYEEMKYRIGFVPQQELLRMNDTVVRTLDDAAKLRLPVQITEKERREIIDSVSNTLGLGAREGLVGKKSGGMKKRISIGTELISDPELFILDEPDSGLDGVIARELFEKLRSIADEGKIVITITHTPDRVADLFDKVIVLARDSGKVGRLAFYGSPDEAREFFGKKTMEQIVMAINREDAGGEGRGDEFIEKYARLTMAEKEVAGNGK